MISVSPARCRTTFSGRPRAELAIDWRHVLTRKMSSVNKLPTPRAELGEIGRRQFETSQIIATRFGYGNHFPARPSYERFMLEPEPISKQSLWSGQNCIQSSLRWIFHKNKKKRYNNEYKNK